MRLLSLQQIGLPHPFSGAELPAVLLGAAAFLVVNNCVVGVAVALHQGVAIGQYLRNEVWFVVGTGAVLLFLAPIGVAASAYSLALLPLFAAPMVAIHSAGRQAMRSEHAARHDPLTGLPNRTAFQTAVETAVRNNGCASCVLLMDLDRFKEVNDTLGHA